MNETGTDTVYGLALEDEPIPEGCLIVEAVVLLEALDSDGNTRWFIRQTPGMNIIKRVGILQASLYAEQRLIFRESDDEE